MFRAAMAPRMAAGMVDGNQTKTSLNQPVEGVAAGQAAKDLQILGYRMLARWSE